jgi:hypothetical protein
MKVSKTTLELNGLEPTPQNKAAARDAIGVSTVRGGRRFGAFAGRQQLAERAPVSSMPFCGLAAGGGFGEVERAGRA